MLLIAIYGMPHRGRKNPLDALTAAVAVIWLLGIAYPLAILTLPLLLVQQLASLLRKLVQN